jgi:hypothetical protein
MNTPPTLSDLRAEYDEKYRIFADAEDEALRKAKASVEHLRLVSARAYKVLRAAYRREAP